MNDRSETQARFQELSTSLRKAANEAFADVYRPMEIVDQGWASLTRQELDEFDCQEFDESIRQTLDLFSVPTWLDLDADRFDGAMMSLITPKAFQFVAPALILNTDSGGLVGRNPCSVELCPVRLGVYTLEKHLESCTLAQICVLRDYVGLYVKFGVHSLRLPSKVINFWNLQVEKRT
jgi:hypothetical protein